MYNHDVVFEQSRHVYWGMPVHDVATPEQEPCYWAVFSNPSHPNRWDIQQLACTDDGRQHLKRLSEGCDVLAVIYGTAVVIED